MRQWFSAGLLLILGGTAVAQSAPSGFKVDRYGGTILEGTAMAWTPDGRLLVAELGGKVRVIKDGSLRSMAFHTVAVDHAADSDRGLLGLCVDPGFATNGYVYVYCTKPSPAPHNGVRRLKASSGGADVSDGTETAIVDLETLGSDTMHNGGAIHFGPDGKLYVAVGDNADAGKAQSITSRFGKILRYNPDGTIPGDNPTSFAGIPGTPSGDFRAIWAVGLRNPFRFAFQPGTSRMYINDVGVSTWEEVNAGAAGRNYGWEGGSTDGARHQKHFTDPVYQYGHSGAAPTGTAITGGVFYNPAVTQFPGSYAGRYFFSDFGAGFIYSIDPAAPDAATPFVSSASGPVDLEVGPDGALYYLDDMGSPGVYRVSYGASSAPTPAPAPAGDGDSGGGSCGATGVEPVVLLVLAGLLRPWRRKQARR